MSLLIGTRNGLFRTNSLTFSDCELVIDCGWVNCIRGFNGVDGIFAATNEGLYRSFDDGQTWNAIKLPKRNIWDIFRVSDGRIYVGSHPAHLFYSETDGETWIELDSLRRQTTVDMWTSAYHEAAQVRTIVAHPEAPDRLFAGIEAGGLYRSEDRGKTWSKCEIRDESGVVQDDIHRIISITPEQYVVACGRLSLHDPNHAAAEGGLYYTNDAGATWTRLDRDLDPSYYRDLVFHDGKLYTCGATTVPPEWSGFLTADATMFVSDGIDSMFEEVPYPGGPDEIILAYATDGKHLLAGTAVGEQGRIIYEQSNTRWKTAGHVPEDVLSLHVGRNFA